MYTIRKSSETEQHFIQQQIKSFNKPHFPLVKYHDLSFHIKDENKNMIAGINGDVFDQVAEVHFFWVSTEVRNHGIGQQLLTHFEQEAIKIGASYLLLDTFDFQAPGFYEKQGFELLAKTPPLYNGSAKNYYHKSLKK